MLVYVMNMDGEPLMPSRRCGRIRRLLRDGRAEVVRRTPFTIRLLYDTGGAVQDVTLGVDSGFFDIRTMDGEKVNKGSVSCKKLRLMGHTNGYLIERRSRSPLTAEAASVRTA